MIRNAIRDVRGEWACQSLVGRTDTQITTSPPFSMKPF